MWQRLKTIVKEPTSYLGGGFITVALEQVANGNTTSSTWVLLISGIIGLLKKEQATK